jgi:hypothetical protein
MMHGNSNIKKTRVWYNTLNFWRNYGSFKLIVGKILRKYRVCYAPTFFAADFFTTDAL